MVSSLFYNKFLDPSSPEPALSKAVKAKRVLSGFLPA